MKNSLHRLSVAAALVLLPVFVHAHPGHDITATVGFFDGLLHPWSGIDHLLAMLAVGIWSAQFRGTLRWILPACFAVVMMLGARAGLAHVIATGVEPAIALSVLLLGVVIATAIKLPAALATVLIGVFAMVHGYAHGAEMPAHAAALPYFAGFMLSTLALQLMGFGVGHYLKATKALRAGGAAIALCGAWLLT